MSENTDRNDPPGLSAQNLIDMTRCRQLTRHVAQSTAIHSQSRGWLRRVKLDLTTIPLTGPGEAETLELIIAPDDLRQLRLVINAAMDRADEDARRGIFDG